MAEVQTRNGLVLFYRDDCFAPPWTTPEAIFLLIGIETGIMWWRWVPILAPAFRVIRPDMRGFGGSSVPPPDSSLGWTPSELAGDVLELLDSLGLAQIHLVGAKFASAAAVQFAADHPDRVRTLTVLTPHIQGRPEVVDSLGTLKPDEWITESNRRRYGSAPAEEVAFWAGMMAAADEHSLRGHIRAGRDVDLVPLLPRVEAPTLLITSDRDTVPVARVAEWQRAIPRGELLALPSDGYNIAAVRPAECATSVMSFIRRHQASVPISEEVQRV
jgi:pimeloyl-ACP methyl ester carboxylesterase